MGRTPGLRLSEGAKRMSDSLQAVVRCDTCGGVIHDPDSEHVHEDDPTLGRCNACLHLRGGFCGNMNDGHYNDDPSGASGSWDNAVKLREGE